VFAHNIPQIDATNRSISIQQQTSGDVSLAGYTSAQATFKISESSATSFKLNSENGRKTRVSIQSMEECGP